MTLTVLRHGARTTLCKSILAITSAEKMFRSLVCHDGGGPVTKLQGMIGQCIHMGERCGLSKTSHHTEQTVDEARLTVYHTGTEMVKFFSSVGICCAVQKKHTRKQMCFIPLFETTFRSVTN